MSHFLRDMLHAAATLVAAAVAADYYTEGRARRDAATEPKPLTPTPIYAQLAREHALVAEFAREVDYRLDDVVREWSR